MGAAGKPSHTRPRPGKVRRYQVDTQKTVAVQPAIAIPVPRPDKQG
jgi:hypothetical protein